MTPQPHGHGHGHVRQDAQGHGVDGIRADSRFAVLGALLSLYGGLLVWLREQPQHSGLLVPLLALAAAGPVGWYLSGGPARRTTLARVGRALRHQRLTFVPLLPLAVLTVASGSAILDQLPDVQRRWVTDGEGGQAVWSIAMTALLAVALYGLGRLRTHQAAERCAVVARPAAASFLRRTWAWLVLPAVPPLLSLLPASWPHIQPRQVAGFVAIPLLIVGISAYLRRRWGATDPPALPGRACFAPEDVPAVARVGDLAAHLVAVVGAWSLIRSFTPLVGVSEWDGPARRFVALGFSCAAAVWFVPLLGRIPVVRRLLGRLRRPEHHTLVRAVAVAASILLFLLVAWLGPVMGPVIGVPATVTLTLGLLTAIVASIALELNAHETPEALRWLGFRSSPVVTMLVGAVLVAAFVTPYAQIHRIYDSDHPSYPTPDPRPTLEAEFTAWLARPGCVVPDRGGAPGVRPMLLVAAEGGGIRATWWTVEALRVLTRQTPRECGRDATLFSGGASGGAVGLTVTTFSDRPSDAVQRMAGPAALAQAGAALFGTDLLYGITGAPLLPHADGPSRKGWRDRALLIENSWVGSADDPDRWGDRPFPDARRGPAGALVLNSTSSARGCRVWLSQLSFGATTGTPGDCDSAPGPAQRTIDFFAAYRPLVAPGVDASAQPARRGAPQPAAEPTGCVGELRAATVALLTARFPYVTPSGVVGPCAASTGIWDRMNLVDGGYVENSGLATLTDLAPEWVTLLREHNACVTARRPECAGRPLVAPVVVYLDNGVDPSVRSSWYERSELFIPLLTGLKGKTGLSGDAALLSRAAKLVDPALVCPTSLGATCREAVGRALPRRIIDVQETGVNPLRVPLGWVLSEASRRSLEDAMLAQRCTRAEGGTTGTLGDLIAMLGGDACPSPN